MLFQRKACARVLLQIIIPIKRECKYNRLEQQDSRVREEQGNQDKVSHMS